MSLAWFLFPVATLLLAGVLAQSDAPVPIATTAAAPPQSTACGTIVNDPDGNFLFNASLVYECLTSVPFNPAVASRFLQYYNETLQFQSTLLYLKNAPTSYQQPAVDLLSGIEWLQNAVNNGSFANQYEFEAALQALILAAHDGHLSLNAGVLSAFRFASPRDIISLSIDGVEPPKVYLAEDVFFSDSFRLYQPSAIKTINGQDATEFLSEFAARNAIGTIEPHADWNQLMFSPAQDVQGFLSIFSGAATFYPGDEIVFGFENETTLTDRWLGVYLPQGPTGPLETGGDFYNFFVLGLLPASFIAELTTGGGTDPGVADFSPTETSTTDSAASVPSAPDAPTPTTLLGWGFVPGYPTEPAVAQPKLGSSGWVTGYFFPESSLAVLSIPSFDAFDDSYLTFQTAVADFLTKSKDLGLTKVVIDLQQNAGGAVPLALDTFRRFFPTVEPHTDSRIRIHPMADVLGQTMTAFFSELDPISDSGDIFDLASDEWVATEGISELGARAWSQFAGPLVENGDNFSISKQYNLTDKAFAASAAQNVNFSIFVPAEGDTPPFAPENIVLLTDGICGSSCALFLGMMHHDAGVRVVAAGGRPTSGPMQGASGTRGSVYYSMENLDAHINFTQTALESGLVAISEAGAADAARLPNRTAVQSVFVVSGSVNLRDQLSPSSQTPLQFAYDAADCRIWYTPQTVSNYTALWQYAADAIWNNDSGSLCVANSTGFAGVLFGNTTADNLSPQTQPPITSPESFNLADHVTITGNGSTAPDTDALAEPLNGCIPLGNLGFGLPLCASDADCRFNSVCVQAKQCTNFPPRLLCVPRCAFPSLCAGSCSLLQVTPADQTAVGSPFSVGSSVSTLNGACLPLESACDSRGNPTGLAGLNGVVEGAVCGFRASSLLSRQRAPAAATVPTLPASRPLKREASSARKEVERNTASTLQRKGRRASRRSERVQ